MRPSEFLEEYYEKKKKEAQLPQQETMTSIDFLMQKLINDYGMQIGDDYLIIQQAKEMHKQEIIDAYFQCGKDNFDHIKVCNRSAVDYYQETFVSKGSDEKEDCENTSGFYQNNNLKPKKD